MSHSTVQTPVGDYADTDLEQSRRKQCVLTLSRRPIIPIANLPETWKSLMFSWHAEGNFRCMFRKATSVLYIPGKWGENL